MTDAATVTLMDPFHDANYTPTAAGHAMPSVVRQMTRTVTVNCNQTTPIKSFVIGGMPIGCPSHWSDLTTQYAHREALQLGPNTGCRTYGPFVAWNRIFPPTVPQEFNTRLNAYTYSSTSRPAVPMLAPVFLLASTNETFSFVDGASVGATGVGSASFTPNTALMNGYAVFGDPDIYRSGPTRVLSIAYEVHNVSSALNKQGTITIGVPPLRSAESSGSFIGASSVNANSVQYNATEGAPIVSISSLPKNSGELLLFPASRQWESAHGVYAIYPPTEEDSTFEEPVGTMFVCPSKRPYDVNSLGTGGIGTSAGIVVTNASFASATTTEASNVIPGPGTLEPFTPVWSFFEGLNSESVFTITVKITYETIPYPGTDIASLVRYPEPNDIRPLAFKIYRELTPFCFVGENASGKMWRKIAAVGASLIPAVYPALRNSVPPGARFITDQAVSMGSKALGNYAKSGKGKSKKKKATDASRPVSAPATVGNPRMGASKGKSIAGHNVMIKTKE